MRTVGVLIRFELGGIRKDVRPNGEHSLTAKLHAVTVADTGSSPVVHPNYPAGRARLPDQFQRLPHGSIAQQAEHPVLTREVVRSILARSTKY